MNLDQLTLGENRALLPHIIKEIQMVALRISQDNEYLTRRDLVKHLNSNIPGLTLTDGLVLNSLVKETYQQTPSSEIKKAITKSFRHNIAGKPVYDPDNISDIALSLNNSGELAGNLNDFSQITGILDRKVDTLSLNDPIAEISEMKKEIELFVPDQNFSLTGRTKVKDNLKCGQKVLEGYGNLVEYYKMAKYQNQELIENFKFLRNELGSFRSEVTELLFDIIGEDKKEEHPELFDFSQIEYLETDRILKEIDLEFENLNDSFEVFQEAYEQSMMNIRDAGKRHADIALERYSKTVKRKGYASRSQVKAQVATAAIGFAFDAALEIVETRNNAEQTVAAIKRDVEKMKLSLKEDAQKIAIDLLRLRKIFNRLKVILIPEAKKFINRANLIYNTTIKDSYNQLLEGGNIAELSKENRRLHLEEKRIYLEIEDKKEGLQVCAEEISKYRELIAEIQNEYDFVNSIEPDLPGKNHSKFSFELATRNYEKHLAEWTEITEPVRSAYASYVECIKMEEETIDQFENLIIRFQKRQEEIKLLRKANKSNIKAQGIKIKNFEPQLEALEQNIRKISEASRNLMSRGIQEDLIKVEKQANYDENLSFESSDGITATLPGVSNETSSYLINPDHRLQLKIELLKFTEMAFTGEIISSFVGEEKEHIIEEHYGKVREHLTHKLSQHSKLDALQAARLVDIGSKIFLGILKTQELKAETNFLMELNSRLDQEFMIKFEKAVADMNVSLEKDRQDAQTVDNTLYQASTADDLLNASRIIDNN